MHHIAEGHSPVHTDGPIIVLLACGALNTFNRIPETEFLHGISGTCDQGGRWRHTCFTPPPAAWRCRDEIAAPSGAQMLHQPSILTAYANINTLLTTLTVCSQPSLK